MSNVHALRRTSPNGGPFLGTCMKCGIEGLSLMQLHQPCANPANMSRDETLMLAISDSDGSGAAGETGTGSTEGDSAGRQASPNLQDRTLLHV